MKKNLIWMLAAILVCGLAAVSYGLSLREKTNAQEENPVQQVVSTELIRTS